MSVTLVCAACTVIYFIMSEISDGEHKWGDDNIHVEYASAFFTGKCILLARVRTPPGNLEYSWIFIWNFPGPGKPGEMMLFFEI